MNLWKDGIEKTWNVHVLVALAFLEKTGECVNHKNGRKLDNRANNLEWTTYKENNNHAIKTKLRLPKTHKILCKELNLIFINPYKAGQFILNQNITSAKLDTVYRNILTVAKKGKGTAYKYHWKFL